MAKKRSMLPVHEVDLTAVKYEPLVIKAPHLTGFVLKVFVWLVESPLFWPLITSFLKKRNKIPEMLQYTMIPEKPMFRPEFPPQEPESAVICLSEDSSPAFRVESALGCLPPYKPPFSVNDDTSSPLYWTIRDYAYAYRSKKLTPSAVAENIISALEDTNIRVPPMCLLISFNVDDFRKQAACSTSRFEEGRPLSVLDGVFIAVKDDIDLFPYPTKGGTTWFDKVREVERDAVCISRLRSCGAIFIGKANMHELGLGTTGCNSNYGTARNPHSPDRYTGGSSSGPAAIVAAGLCPAAIGTDGGGSIRIPSSLCGVVGLKTTYGRTDMEGTLCECGTVEVVGPIASTVEDVLLLYAAMLGCSIADKLILRPSPPCLPCLSSPVNLNMLRTMRLGKYSKWFTDVHSTEIRSKCEKILEMLADTYGCEVNEIVLPELHEMRNAHIVSIGSESLASLSSDCADGRGAELTLDCRINLALFRSFSAAEYVAAQRLRRRIMYYHLEAFKQVDVIVTPTSGMTAPSIPLSSIKAGESNLEVSGYLMRYVLAGNLLGLPAITVPVGHDEQGLPIGLQLIGRPWCEATILRLATAVEALSFSYRNRPSVFYDVLRAT